MFCKKYTNHMTKTHTQKVFSSKCSLCKNLTFSYVYVCVCVCVCVCARVRMLRRVQLFVTLWIVTRQFPLSMRFFQARILEWVAISLSTDLPDPGIKPVSSALRVDFLPLEPSGKHIFPYILYKTYKNMHDLCSQ